MVKISQNKNYKDDLIELIESKNSIQSDSDFVKICPRCREKYIERYNYCRNHEEQIKLVYIDDLIKICSNCKKTYPKEYNFCPQCDSNPLTVEIKKIKTQPNEYYNFNQHLNKYGEISQLLCPSNKEKLINFDLSENEFNNIINNIKNTNKTIFDYLIEEYNIDLDSLTTLNKILLFSKSFVKTYYKNGGGDLGHFEFNEIYIDDRATDALQITTIIHELSHFLLAEILEQIISIVFDCEKTEVVEAFVCYNLANEELNYLIDEYCAHTVEGSFAVFGYQDYGSYELRLSKFLQEYSEEYVEVVNTIGNTFAKYIKEIMESFIDEKLRSDIKDEFSKIKDLPKYTGLKYETTDILYWQGFSKSIRIMLTQNIDQYMNNPQDIEKLRLYSIKFKKNNEG